MTLAKFVTQREFNDLPWYQFSDPTGAYYNGKSMKFKRRHGWIWYQYEYVEIGKVDRVGIAYTPILVYGNEE